MSRKRAYPSAIDTEGKTALIHAAKNNSESEVKRLIDTKVNVDESDDQGKTALFYAAQNDNEDMVRALIDAGADVELKDDEGKTALFYAADNKSTEDTTILQALVENGNAFVNAKDIHGRTPLFYAITNSTALAHCLVDHGGSIHIKDNCNVSILSFLIENCLMKQGSPSNIVFLSEAIHLLIEKGLKRWNIVQTIIKLVFCKVPLLLTASECETIQSISPENISKAFELARQYVDEGDDEQKQTILMIERKATSGKVLEAFELLAGLVGDDPDSCDTAGNTALHYATLLPLLGVSKETIMEIFKKLREIGAKFDVKNHQNQTPLLFCLSENHWKLMSTANRWSGVKILAEVCKFIMKSGSNVCETLQSGESVFHLLMKLFQVGLGLCDKEIGVDLLQGAMELLHLFSSAKVARKIVNKSDASLNSPLHLWASLELSSPQDYSCSIIENHTFEKFLQKILECLLKCGAKLNSRNDNEETPLHLCKTWSAVKLLIGAGANPNDVDSSGRPPLLVAAKNKTFLKNEECFYPDIAEDPNTFWKTAIEKGLDPWTSDRHDGSVLSILIESDAFLLARALIDVACENNNTKSGIKAALMNAICRDRSRHTHWKIILAKTILKSGKFPINAALHFCCGNIMEEAKEECKQNSATSINSVHFEIVKLLRSHGADCETQDSSGKSCLEKSAACPALKELLTKEINIKDIDEVIPWTSASKTYKSKLDRVARQQECKVVDRYWHHKDSIASGQFGQVYAGINVKDGREVAIKRIVKENMKGHRDKREIKNLLALTDCEQVVRYLDFFEDNDFSFVVLELMDGNLEQYLNGSTIDASISTLLCKDVVMGLKYLHEKNILHRNLKPGNILYKATPKLCLKIADFGLSRCIDSTGSNTVYSINSGTKCWIAPEVLTSKSHDHSKSSDMFSCGLVLHYTLSVRNPFSPTNCANKSELQMTHETEDNIMNGKMEGWDNSLSPEASDLVKKMLESNESNRTTAGKALDHPFFWSQEKKEDFLIAVGNEQEFECPRSKRTQPLTLVEKELENNIGTTVIHGTWNDPRYLKMPGIYAKTTNSKKARKSYDTGSVVELVRFIRNAYVHVSRDLLFLDYFPHLVMEVYKVVTTHGWDQTRDEVKSTMNK